MEFAAPVWNFYNQVDIDRVEKVHKRATKVAYVTRFLEYDDRLRKFGLTKLDERRKRGECVQQYKLMNGLETVNWAYPPKTSAPMYGHRMRQRKEIVKSCDQRHHFFTNRVANW